MVSDLELVEKLREMLSTADLATTTAAIVRRRLEEHFGVELSEKKVFVREQIDLFLQEQEKDEDGGEGNAEAEAEEEEEEEEEGTSDGKKSSKSNTGTKRKAGGFTKVCSLSPQLQKFIGESELPRTQVVKQIWAYIRENSLQDPKNKRKIICDDRLYELFKVKTIDMFQMNKVLAKHIWPLGADSAPPAKEKEKQQKKEKQEVQEDDSEEEEEEDEDEAPQKQKRRKAGSNGFLIPLPLSDALANFIGTGESALSRSEVVKKMWEYIKQNNLQDPSDKRRILCDDKLKELFSVDSFTGFTVAKLLAPHFVKP